MLAFLERDIPIKIYNSNDIQDIIFKNLRKLKVYNILFYSGITKSKSEAKKLISQNCISMCRKSGKWEKIKIDDIIYLLGDEDIKNLFEKCPSLIIQYDSFVI